MQDCYNSDKPWVPFTPALKTDRVAYLLVIARIAEQNDCLGNAGVVQDVESVERFRIYSNVADLLRGKTR